MERVENSPLLEKLNRKGFEVVYLIDPIDEDVIGQLKQYKGKNFVYPARGGLRFYDEEEKQLEGLQQEYREVFDFIKENLGRDVRMSYLLVNSPCVMVNDALEINLRNALIQHLRKIITAGEKSKAVSLCKVLLHSAILTSGMATQLRSPSESVM